MFPLEPGTQPQLGVLSLDSPSIIFLTNDALTLLYPTMAWAGEYYEQSLELPTVI